jgi:two-component system response regulator FimZ (fimbrial Z protein)
MEKIAMIRIYMIEDHPVTISGLHSYFRPSRGTIRISGSAATVEEALLKANPDTFDVILLDLWLPEADPVDNYKQLSKKFPNKPVLVYTYENSIHWQRKMFKAGVKAFINKQATKGEIQQTLEKVMNGETVYTSYVKDFQSRTTINCYNDPKYNLSKEQKVILTYFIEGLSSRKIAETINKSISSVDRTLRDIREIFLAPNNFELIKILLQLDNEGLYEIQTNN